MYNAKVYEKQGAEELVVASGGAVTVQSGGALTAESGSVINLSAATVTLPETQVRYAAGMITNGELKALRATPKELVPAPGAGKYLELIALQLFLDYGANVLTESADNLAVKLGDGSGTIVSQAIEATGFIDASADTVTNGLPKIDAIVAKTAAENKALVLHNTGDGEYGGNAGADTVIRFKVAYRVHTTGW